MHQIEIDIFQYLDVRFKINEIMIT